ncbi:ABC transporter permease [Campylobacter lari]|uniref:ABC transporter permease n=1 Tax=Campylobacter lari TaxID=201 RepID=A0A7U8G1T6_CAMLA|nr:ABC transporter permease [Campylobacter lari]
MSRYVFNTYFLLFILILFSFVSLFIGVNEIYFANIFSLTKEEIEILTIIRLPRLISIVITGMSLSICGLIMQQLMQNKFVSPTTAGTMDCAKFGILICMLFFNGMDFIYQVFMAFIFAFIGSIVFIQILQKIKFKEVIFVPLVGLMFGGVINSITTFFAYENNLIQNIQGWLQGNFSSIMQGNYELLFISIPIFIIAYFFANKITIAGMGEDISLNLGVSYNTILYIGLIIISIAVSIVVLTVGVLPFLGLLIPNLVSIYKGDNLKSSLFHTALLGSIFLLICDILSRSVIYPFEIPINLTVGVIGGIFFVWILLRKKTNV